jgi:hypothetical protein
LDATAVSHLHASPSSMVGIEPLPKHCTVSIPNRKAILLMTEAMVLHSGRREQEAREPS